MRFRQPMIRCFILLLLVPSNWSWSVPVNNNTMKYNKEKQISCTFYMDYSYTQIAIHQSSTRGARWLSGRVSDSGARGPGFERPTAAVLCSWARYFTPRKYWLITQEAMAPSRHDWKIVDWDVKPQHNQPTNQSSTSPVYIRAWI